MKPTFLTTVSLILMVPALMAPSRAATPAEDTFQPLSKPTLEISRTSLPIVINGQLDDAGWQKAARADNFCEYFPGDGTRPPVKTEAWMTYDDENVYVAMICQDDPRLIRSSMCDRDRIYEDDNVVILIDTYGDAAWAYEFTINPRGIQGDLLWSRQGDEDPSFDAVWRSAGMVTDSGYQVEAAIPFSSLRFPHGPTQTWRVDFWRNHPRNSRGQYSWAAIDRDEPCWPCMWGTVTGIVGVKPGKGLELLPAFVAYQYSALAEEENPDTSLHDRKPKGEISLGAKYTVSSNMTLEAAYNPDFSQVESDAAQINLNTTYALYYPEHRPFFQEGSDLFQTAFQSFNSRMINDPGFAARATGRFGRTSVAYITAYDEHSPMLLPFDEFSYDIPSVGKSYANVLRVKRTFGEDSYVGILMTDRRFEGGGAGTYISGDGAVRLAKNYRFAWQAAGSRTAEPDWPSLTTEVAGFRFDSGDYSASLDGESFWGHGVFAGVEREGRHWGFDLNYTERSPTFRPDLGYEPANNRRELMFNSEYMFFPNSRFVDQIGPTAMVARVWNFAKERRDEWAEVGLEGTLKKQTTFEAGYLISREKLRGIIFPDIMRVSVAVNSRFSDLFGMGFAVVSGHTIARLVDPPVMGNEIAVEASTHIKPLDRLLIEPVFNYNRSTSRTTGQRLFEGSVARTRLNLQLTRELSLRLIAQYSSFWEISESKRANGWQIDPLLTYRINAFSLFYAGSTYDYQDFYSTRRQENRWALNTRQFFLKLQYLFQF